MKFLLFLLLLTPLFLQAQPSKTWDLEELEYIDISYLAGISCDSVGNIVGGCDRGALVSHNRGKTWDLVELDEPLGPSAAGKEGFFLAYRDSAVWRSTDAGQSWEKVYTASFNRFITWIAILPDGKALLNFRFQPELYLSTDSGTSWNMLEDPSGINMTALNLARHPNGRFYSVELNWVSSFDTIENRWVRYRNAPNSMRFIAIDADGRIVVAGPGGISQSIDEGNSWRTIETGFPATEIKGLAAGSEGVFFINTYQGLYAYNPTEKKWELTSLSDGGYIRPTVWSVQSVPQPDGTLKIYTTSDYEDQAGSIFVNVSTDNGLTWQESFTDRFSASTFRYAGLAPDRSILAIGLFSMKSSTGNTVLNESRLWKSTDDGKNWYTVSVVSSDLNGPYKGPGGELLFVDGAFGSRAIQRSIDNGESWYQWSDILPWFLSILSVANDGRMFASTNDILARSDDHGKTWEAYDYNFPSSSSAYSINAYSVSTSGELAVSKKRDVYYSSDDGITWTREPSPIKTEGIEDLVFTRSGTLLLALEDGSLWKKGTPDSAWTNFSTVGVVQNFQIDSVGGIYAQLSSAVKYSPDEGKSWELVFAGTASTIGRVSIQEDDNIYIPSKGKILRHPVPVPLSVPHRSRENRNVYHLKFTSLSPTEPGNIEFTLPATTNVLLELVDVQGHGVTLLNKTPLSSGTHRYDLPEHLASGRYIVKLCTEDGCEIARGVIVR